MSAGFHGKLPSTGDFVARNLPQAFTGRWDRWIARHLAPRLAPDAPALFFQLGGPPPFSGVVLPSRDRTGRAFPLTLAIPGAACPETLARLAAIGAEAITDALTPDALGARLAGIPGTPGQIHGLVLWTDPTQPQRTDPEAPGPVLSRLLPLQIGAA